MGELQGAHIVYDCERYICIESRYEKLREKGRKIEE